MTPFQRHLLRYYSLSVDSLLVLIPVPKEIKLLLVPWTSVFLAQGKPFRNHLPLVSFSTDTSHLG